MNLFFSHIQQTDVTQQQTGVNRDMPLFLEEQPPPPLVQFPTAVPPSFPQQPVQPTPCVYYYFLLPIDCRALQQQSAQPIVLPPSQLAQQPLQLQSMQTQNAISFVDNPPFQCVLISICMFFLFVKNCMHFTNRIEISFI